MKFKSSLLTQASGSIGGITASRNRGGMYLRARAIPVNTNTSFQQAVRNFMSLLTSRWVNTLTDLQRAAWAVYAEQTPMTDSLGESRTIPALAHYVRSNVARLQAGLTVIDAGPTVYGLPTLSAIDATIDASDGEADIAFTNTDAWATAVGGALAVKISRPQNKSINYFNGPYRFAGAILGAATPPTSPGTLTLPFPVAADQKVFLEARSMLADGRLSSPFRFSVFAAA